MKRLFIIILFTNTSLIFTQNLHKIYDDILHKYVSKGLVDYAELKNDPRLQKYLDILSAIDPDTLKGDNVEKAFWINAYNAFTLKIITDNYPIESINDLNPGGMIISQILGKTVWDRKFILIHNKKYSLNDIEHGIIRKKFNDARLHFALVCGALSCPELRQEAYTAKKLNIQLIEQGKLFLNDPHKNYYDIKNRTAYLSRYFDWYKNDFGGNNKEVLFFISGFISDADVVRSIKNNHSEWKIKYIPYDWCLNVKGAYIKDKRCVFDQDSF